MAGHTVRVQSAGTALPGALIDTRAPAERFGMDHLWADDGPAADAVADGVVLTPAAADGTAAA